ncbi:MAG: T9SS type A sorting domain-containing protein [Flavobacteriales bacterium]
MRITFGFCLLLPTLLAAQPVLEHPAAIPAFGPHPVETRSYGVVPGLAQSGTGVVWDLSAIDPTVIGTTTDSVLDPTATPYAAYYPDATHAVRLVDQFGYYRVSASAVDDLGYRLSPGSTSFIYSDPARILQFPSEIGDSWSDATLSGATASTLTVTVLAEGEIRLADATIHDAVLIRRQYAGSSSNATSTTWFRRSDGLRPLGNLLANGTVIMRVPQELGTGISPRKVGQQLQLYPNPTPGELRIVSAGTGVAEVQLFDATGRSVRRTSSNASVLVMDLSDLADGSYLLVVQQGGERSSRPILKAGY